MKVNHIVLLHALLLCASGCTKEVTGIPETNEKGEYAVSFSSGIDLQQTKASGNTENLTENGKATIWAYKSDATPGSGTTAITNGGYTADGSSNLTGASEYKMYLAKEIYDFYGVSTNSSTESVPAFTDGTSDVLKNGVDYLWVKVDDKTIPASGNTANTENIELTFARKAVKIMINVVSSDGLELDSWQAANPARITPPDPGTTSKMTLSSGEIAVATALTTEADMTKIDVATNSESGKKEASVSYVMLPLGNDQTPKVTLNVKVKVGDAASAEDRTYEATLGYPSSGFVSGNQYTYKATLKGNSITFTGAKVSGWTNQNQSDLTPTEPDTQP